ncbi:MAG: hypothetical protein EA387_06205 [Nitriliruptor sp.]|nr:MAG: hypothetical protein EA387_06205 [Nitriliruptor sp.]
MNAHTRLLLLVTVALLALTLLAGPAAAQEDVVDDVTTEQPVEDENGRRPLADNPRDRLGLLLLTALFVGGGVALVNGRRQLKGENPQASGEFRWR